MAPVGDVNEIGSQSVLFVAFHCHPLASYLYNWAESAVDKQNAVPSQAQREAAITMPAEWLQCTILYLTSSLINYLQSHSNKLLHHISCWIHAYSNLGTWNFLMTSMSADFVQDSSPSPFFIFYFIF